MEIHNFKELHVWQKSIDLAVQVYEISVLFPREEKFGLVTQAQRSAVSVPSNIAEGCGRISTRELQHFLSVSMGSCFELETQMILACRFGYLTAEKLLTLTETVSQVQRMLYGFYNSLNEK